MDHDLIAALAQGGARATHEEAPASGAEMVQRWAAARGMRPGPWPGPTAGEAAAAASRWAAARGWAPASAREAGGGLRAAGLRTNRPTTLAGRAAGDRGTLGSARFMVATRRLADQLRAEGRAAMDCAGALQSSESRAPDADAGHATPQKGAGAAAARDVL